MTNQPRHDPQTELPDCPQAALKQRLQSAFPPAFPSDPDPEKTIQWLAANIDKGLCRIYAVHLNECLDEEGYKRLVERVSRRIDDPQLMESLKEILAAPSQPEHPAPEPLAPLLTDIAFQEIDHILQQAKALGREDNFLHVQCTRVGNELIVLSDRDPRYDWIVPAVQQRLHEELHNLHYDPAAIETQSFDMTCGEPLRFLDFELRCVKKRSGELQVQYHRVAEPSRRQAEKAPAQRRWLGRYHPLRFLQPALNWIAKKRGWQIVERTYRKANSIQAGWRHLPITLLPVLMLLFGWLSPVALLCFAAILVCNWRWTLSIVWATAGWARRHKLDVTMGACVLGGLVYLYPAARECYTNISGEETASFMPAGFYLGQYNKGSPWDPELVHYGLYVPPHFRREKGPFPLIVFLHGYGERPERRNFRAGLPVSIAQRFGTNKPNGRFQYVAFFPIDPKGRWQAGSAEVENAMMALDYVIERHRIDPARVYLTGHSNGGSGVWELAQAYPDKWAAVAPLCSFISPDVEKVKHLPAWIFHGAKDRLAPVERERYLVQQLKEANADVKYTEFPNTGHVIWPEAYNPKEIYEWLASKKKD